MEAHVTTKDKIAVCVFALLWFPLNKYMENQNFPNHDIWSLFFIAYFAMTIVCRSNFRQKWFIFGMAAILFVQYLIFVILNVRIDELPPYGFVSLGIIYAVAMGGILELSKKLFGHGLN